MELILALRYVRYAIVGVLVVFMWLGFDYALKVTVSLLALNVVISEFMVSEVYEKDLKNWQEISAIITEIRKRLASTASPEANSK